MDKISLSWRFKKRAYIIVPTGKKEDYLLEWGWVINMPAIISNNSALFPDHRQTFKCTDLTPLVITTTSSHRALPDIARRCHRGTVKIEKRRGKETTKGEITALDKKWEGRRGTITSMQVGVVIAVCGNINILGRSTPRLPTMKRLPTRMNRGPNCPSRKYTLLPNDHMNPKLQAYVAISSAEPPYKEGRPAPSISIHKK